jgi:hypothetical protein
MITSDRRVAAKKRTSISKDTWRKILERSNNSCEWNTGGHRCGLEEGSIDPVGGGRVKLSPDHKAPHSLDQPIDPDDAEEWQVLCSRHQVTKKNFWDDKTGKLNYMAIVQQAPMDEKQKIFDFLQSYFET